MPARSRHGHSSRSRRSTGEFLAEGETPRAPSVARPSVSSTQMGVQILCVAVHTVAVGQRIDADVRLMRRLQGELQKCTKQAHHAHGNCVEGDRGRRNLGRVAVPPECEQRDVDQQDRPDRNLDVFPVALVDRTKHGGDSAVARPVVQKVQQRTQHHEGENRPPTHGLSHTQIHVPSLRGVPPPAGGPLSTQTVPLIAPAVRGDDRVERNGCRESGFPHRSSELSERQAQKQSAVRNP